MVKIFTLHHGTAVVFYISERQRTPQGRYTKYVGKCERGGQDFEISSLVTCCYNFRKIERKRNP